MSSRSIEFAENEFYHVYNRGVEKRTIYLDVSDYKRFTELLYVANTSKPTNLRDIRRVHENIYEWDSGETLVAIGAYCLMPNHFHILLTPLQENGISKFMNKLGTSYSMYFNCKYKRTGSLFEGKFKAKWVDSDEYLKYLYSYIHLNPVKLIQSDWKEVGIKNPEQAFNYAKDYGYSSLPDYLGEVRRENKIIDSRPFPDYFTGHTDIKNELLEWLTFQDESSIGKE